ncbi:MAG: patatin-like phospholipase family protein [Vicinamibacteria bacterium]
MEVSAQPKVGLALSGGGFRAAFFHLGVLARLAELGLLRRVEVISTVSGGSIVGAAYYLRLKWLLQARPQAEISDQMYCDLVADVGERLRALVRKNVRGRIFLNPFKNFAMASRRYSRSDRIGDLYDIYLYNPAWEGERPRTRWGADTQIEMRELLIQPPGQPEGFKPDEDNDLLSAKVPILLLNATSLNSGHHWRFEAVRMGEPLPDNEEMRRVVEDADKNIRLEQGYFEPREGKPRVTESQRDFPLALAVAASACVPGLFHPLAISNLYDGITVQLVDGGVQDNQGVQGLFDEDCSHLIVSDASLQLPDEQKPSGRVPGVMTRSMSIQADRIRDEQLTHVSARGHQFALMHLRKGLTGRALAPGESLADAIDEREGAVHCSQFGVDPEVQKALARVRTDLDFYNDTEAFSLSADGYQMSAYELGAKGFEALGAVPAPPADPSRWRFGAVAGQLAKPSDHYLAVIRAGRRSFFRLAAYALGSSWLLKAVVLAALVALVALAVVNRDSLFGWLGDDQPVWTAFAAFAVPALLIGAYMATGTRGIARVPIDWLVGALIPVLLAPLLFAWAVLLLVAVRPLAGLVGRVPEPATPPPSRTP